jgi:hypothetical protein
MRNSARQSCGVLLALALLLPAVGCATKATLRTQRDDSVDFSDYRSWSRLPVERKRDTPRVDVENELSALVLEQIHREFSKRGFDYRREGADLAVDIRLTVTREQHVARHSAAVESLHSFHSSPSYEIQSSEREIVDYERGHLLIRVIDVRLNREVWRGEYENRYQGLFAAHVKAAVASTLGSFPAVATTDPAFDPRKLATHP